MGNNDLSMSEWSLRVKNIKIKRTNTDNNKYPPHTFSFFLAYRAYRHTNQLIFRYLSCLPRVGMVGKDFFMIFNYLIINILQIK